LRERFEGKKISMKSSKSLWLWILVFLSIFVAAISYRFIFLGFSLAFKVAPFAYLFAEHRLYIMAHVLTAPIALGVGCIQFLPNFRTESWARWHRTIGWVYVVSILIGGLSSLVISLNIWDRPFAAAGFMLLSIIWLGTAGVAVICAVRKNFEEHRVWMIRSFALTASAITYGYI